MMSALSPALDTAVTATPATPAAPAGEGSDSSPFAAVIQGLSPDAAVSSSATAPTAAAAASTTPALPASAVASDPAAGSDPLTSALVSVLQALGLSDAASGTTLTPQDDSASDTAAEETVVSNTPDSNAMLLPTVPVLPPTPPVMPATSVLTAVTPGTDPADDAGLLLTSSTGSPAQQQARQWLAALAPAQPGSDSISPDTAVALPTQPQPATAPAPAQVPVLAAGSGWLQQPLTSFFNRAPSSPDSSATITDLAAITPDSLSLSADTPKGLPSALSFTQALSSTSAGTTAPVLATVLPNALQDPAWSDAFGQRVALLAQQGTQTATLQLNPPDLGPIQVRIALGEQGARVEFNTAQQTTSDLIETAMPRLAAAFEHQGLRLDDTRVNLINNRNDVFSAPSAFASARQDTPQGDRGQAAQQAQSSARQAQTSANAETGLNASNVIRLPLPPKSGIDYYA